MTISRDKLLLAYATEPKILAAMGSVMTEDQRLAAAQMYVHMAAMGLVPAPRLPTTGKVVPTMSPDTNHAEGARDATVEFMAQMPGIGSPILGQERQATEKEISGGNV